MFINRVASNNDGVQKERRSKEENCRGRQHNLKGAKYPWNIWPPNTVSKIVLTFTLSDFVSFSSCLKEDERVEIPKMSLVP